MGDLLIPVNEFGILRANTDGVLCDTCCPTCDPIQVTGPDGSVFDVTSFQLRVDVTLTYEIKTEFESALGINPCPGVGGLCGCCGVYRTEFSEASGSFQYVGLTTRVDINADDCTIETSPGESMETGSSANVSIRKGASVTRDNQTGGYRLSVTDIETPLPDSNSGISVSLPTVLKSRFQTVPRASSLASFSAGSGTFSCPDPDVPSSTGPYEQVGGSEIVGVTTVSGGCLSVLRQPHPDGTITCTETNSARVSTYTVQVQAAAQTGLSQFGTQVLNSGDNSCNDQVWAQVVALHQQALALASSVDTSGGVFLTFRVTVTVLDG